MGETSTTGGRWPTPGEALLAALAALVILALGLGGAQRSRAVTLERREVEDRRVLADVAAGVAGQMERSIAALTISGGRAVPNTRVVSVPRGDPNVACSATIPPFLDDPSSAHLLRKACDSGQTEIGEPIDLGEGTRLPIALAQYDDLAAFGATARRATIVGWAVAPLDVGAMAERVVPSDVAVTIREGDERLAGSPDLTEGLPEQELDVRGHLLVLQAGDPARVPWTMPTLALGAGAVLAAAAAVAAILVVGRTRRQQEFERARAYEQVRLVGEVAPLVQQSLELADVLPAVAVQLQDHFGLAGMRLSAGTSSAGQVELFTLGRISASGKPVLVPPDGLDPGESLTLALQRGGRSVALLQVVAGRPLDSSDLGALRAVTELITAAVVNAALYASQQDAVRRLRDLDGLKTVFLSTASHELRTPATAIGGFASLLAGSWDRFDDAQRREFAQRIEANARSLSAVVQDLLDFSLLDRGRLHLTITPLDLGPLARSVVERLGPAVPDHEVVCDIEDAPEVAADANAVERIITNLLTNAAKFSPPDTTITVGVRSNERGATLLVSDQGRGVPPEERDRIFTRFYRGSGEAVVKTRGVGIGLSVVAELTDRMHGSITIDDAPGGGARFQVHLLPATAAHQMKELDDASTV